MSESNGLTFAVGGNVKAFEAAMKKAGKVADDAANEIERRFSKVNPSISTSALTGALKGLGAAVAGVGLERIARGVLAANREIASFATTARQAGVEVQRFQELRFAAGSKGIGGKEFDSGLTGLAKALNDARTEETELSKLFEANGLKLKDRQGTVISTNEALGVAADLISRAATEADKVAIAEKFGIPKDFVPLLEGGASALDHLARNAREAGAVLDEDVVRRAAEFDRAWNGAWNTFTTAAKAAAVEAATGLAGLIQQATEFRQRMLNAAKAGSDMGALMGNTIQGREPPAAAPAGTQTTAPLPPSRPGRGYIGSDVTRVPSKSSGGGGGGGKSEAEQRQEQVARYIESLEKVNRVLEAERATLGKSKAERAAAIELARIGTVTDDGQRQKIMEIVQANEALRQKIDEVKKSQKGLVEAQNFFGDAITDSLGDLILDGEKATDVVKNLAKALAKAALQAALIGGGPLAGLFGTGGSNGNAGGLLGGFGGLLSGNPFSAGAGGYGGQGPFISGIPGRASGGPVSAGKPYIVGEKRPELFVPNTSGRIIPKVPKGISQPSSSNITVSPVYHIDARGADPAAVARIEAGLAQRDRQFGRNVQGVVRQTNIRGTRA